MNISVLISVYVKEKPDYLNECLQSLVNQTHKADEVVLVQDGPISAEIIDIIERYRADLNIVSVPLSKNVGLACALNEGLQHCKHDLVARMDTDDIAMPDRFEKQLDFMVNNPDIAASSGFLKEFDDSGQFQSQRTLPIDHDDLVNFAKKRSPLSHPAVIFRKQSVNAVGGYPEIYPEDFLLWIKLIQNGFKIANIPYVLVKMRTGEAVITRRGWTFLKGELKIYKYMYKTNFINTIEYLKMIFIRTLLRLAPKFIKLHLYKVAR